MKWFLYCVLLTTLGIILVTPAAGQITITSTDVGAQFTPGNTTVSRVDTGTNTVDIGSTGATTWDFSALVNNFSVATTAVNPDTTEFFSSFPDATHAIRTGPGYTYYKLATNLEFLGYAQPSPTEILTRQSPPQIVQQLPMTMGSSWTTSYAETSIVSISGTLYMTITNHVVNYTVDAYGSLTFPGGGVDQALRLKSDRYITTGLNTFRSITYQILTKGGASVSVVPADTNQPQTGPISVSSLSWNTTGGTTSVEEVTGATVPSAFVLEQNYPNPFNPATTIRFAVTGNAFVSLKVYDVLGEEVSTLVSEQLAPGRYSVQWDGSRHASGVYAYRLQSGAHLETRRLVLLR